MSSLAHKRTVVVTWIFRTIAGVMAAGPASEALKTEFSTPDKQSRKTNPDPMSAVMAEGWRTGAAKEFERQNAALVQAEPVAS